MSVIEEWTSEIAIRDPSRLHQMVPSHRPGEGAIGDCWRTGLACLLGASHAYYVPHFVEQTIDHENGQWEVLRVARHWLRDMHLDIMPVQVEAVAEWDCPYLLSVRSKKGDWNHVVVAWGREVWHDPSALDDGYCWSDRVEDQAAEVLCRPYSPDPEEMVRRWIAEAGTE